MKPILFNTEMVRAIQNGTKTVTRRVVKLKYSNTHLEMFTNKYGTRLVEKQNEEPGVTIIKNQDGTTTHTLLACIEKEPPYHPNDILYVRETWAVHYCDDWSFLQERGVISKCNRTQKNVGCYVYRADGHGGGVTPCGTWPAPHAWRPSIHMPREAARIFLRVTNVRVERLQDITDEDAEKEGCNDYTSTVCGFADVWDSTIKPADRAIYGWYANPCVWVIEFEQCEKPEAT